MLLRGALRYLAFMPKMSAALESIVREDLGTHFFPGLEPPADMSWRYTEAVLDFTLLMSKTNRSSIDGADHQEELQALATEFKHLLNGDMRKGRLAHYCYLPGCCQGRQREVAVKRVVALLVVCWFQDLGSNLPSTMRWYTFRPHLATQAGACLCFRLLGRVVRLAFTLDKCERRRSFPGCCQ